MFVAGSRVARDSGRGAVGLVADVVAYLQSLSPEIMDGSTEWRSVMRNMNDGMGDQLIVFREDGGTEPETPSEPGTMGDSALMEPSIHVTVRGRPQQGNVAVAKAQEIQDALHGLLRVQMGSTHYMRVKAQMPEPLFYRYDERERPLVTQSFRALRAVVA